MSKISLQSVSWRLRTDIRPSYVNHGGNSHTSSGTFRTVAHWCCNAVFFLSHNSIRFLYCENNYASRPYFRRTHLTLGTLTNTSCHLFCTLSTMPIVHRASFITCFHIHTVITELMCGKFAMQIKHCNTYSKVLIAPLYILLSYITYGTHCQSWNKCRNKYE